MSDSILIDVTSDTLIRTWLAYAAVLSYNEHQKSVTDKNSPNYDPEIEESSSELSVKITDRETGKPLYPEIVVDNEDPLGSVAIDNPFGASTAHATERQRRFEHVVMLASLISGQFKNPANTKVCVTNNVKDYTNDGHEPYEANSFTYKATETFNAGGVQENVELEDEKGKVGLSELQRIHHPQ